VLLLVDGGAVNDPSEHGVLCEACDKWRHESVADCPYCDGAGEDNSTDEGIQETLESMRQGSV